MNRILRYLDRLEKAIISIGIFSTSVLIFVNVILRYFFDYGLVWAEEVVRYIIVYIVMIGSSLAISKNEHIAVTLLEDSSNKWVAHISYGLQNIISLVFTVIVTYFGCLIVTSLIDTKQITAALQIPAWWVYIIFPISTFLMSIRISIRIYEWIRTKEIPAREGAVE